MKVIILALVVCVSVFAGNNNEDTTKSTNRYYIYITPQAHTKLMNQQRSQRLQAFLRQNMRPVVKRDDESSSLTTRRYIQPMVSRTLILQRATTGNKIDDYKERTQKAFTRYTPRMKQTSLDQLQVGTIIKNVQSVVARPTIFRAATQGDKIDDYKEKTKPLTKASIRRTTPMKLKSINRQIFVKTKNNIQPKITRAPIIRSTSKGNKIEDYKEKSRQPTNVATRKLPVINRKSYLRDTNSLDRQILFISTNIFQPSRTTILRTATQGKKIDDYKEKSQKLTTSSSRSPPRMNKSYQRPVVEDVKKTSPRISTARRASVSKMDDFMNKVEKLMGTPKVNKKQSSNPDRQPTYPRFMTFDRATPSHKIDDLKTSNTYYTNPNYRSGNQLIVGVSTKPAQVPNMEKTKTTHSDSPNQIPFNNQYYYPETTTPLPTAIPMEYMPSKTLNSRTRHQMQDAVMNGYFVPEASLSRSPSESTTNRYSEPALVQNPHTTIKIMETPIHHGSLTPASYPTNTQTATGRQYQSSTYKPGIQPATADQPDSRMGTRSYQMMSSSMHGTGNHLPTRGDAAFSCSQQPINAASASSMTSANVATRDNAVDFINAFFNHLKKNIPPKDPYHVPTYYPRGYY